MKRYVTNVNCGVMVLTLFLALMSSGCMVSKNSNTNYLNEEINHNGKLEVISVAGNQVQVEVMRTPQERAQGLSGRERLGEDEGMLFLFEEAGVHGFWMKDMNFPLDMIWIRDDVIVDISHNVPTTENGQIARRSPGEPADTVLEVNAGWAVRNEVRIDDGIIIKKRNDWKNKYHNQFRR